MVVLEECQGCGSRVPVRCPSGRAASHYIDGTIAPSGPDVAGMIRVVNTPVCGRSGHPTRQELARRKDRRTERRRALVEEGRVNAAVALDAFLEGRTEFADRIKDFERAALFLFNGRHQTHVRRPWTWREHGYDPGPDPENPAPTAAVRCVFCTVTLEVVPLAVVHKSGPVVAWRERHHLTACALRYLAGLLILVGANERP